ncbi:MAG TPA: SprT family zinc-dependent metalloprotease [Patescibacteria group bacterium]
MGQITISNIQIDVVRKDIKNIHLAVYPPTGRIRIAAPIRVNDETVRLFAISKLSWIKRNQRKFEGQERQMPREYKTRESHYYHGKRYLLRVIETETRNKIVLRSKTYIDMYVRKETPTAKRHELMNGWYREQLKKQIPQLLEKWEKKIGVKATYWGIKLMKTKWGSCNIERKGIWLNLELAKKPVHCLQYIIVHEMIHLLERHHNERFLHYMDTFLPNWKQLKMELNKLPISHTNWEY